MHPSRRQLARVLTAGGLGAALHQAARAQDFGKMVEQMAKRKLKETFSEEGLQRAVVNNVQGAVDQQAQRSAGRQALPIKTADGWTLVAHRYPPAGGQRRSDSLPVILCHGLTYSASFFDLEPPVSFVQYLASQGFDVWAVDLRGCGHSQKWVFRVENTTDALIGGAVRRMTKGAVAPTGYQTVDPKYANWTLDDHIAYDVPALVRLVQKVTGSAEVAWVGHSMGGIVALGHLGRFQNPGIGRLVTVGSQVTMRDAQLVVPFLMEMMKSRQLQLAGQLDPAVLAAATQESVNNLFFNTAHVSSTVYQALSMDRTEIPSLGLMRQYLDLTSSGELRDARKSFNYANALANIQIPTLVACGALDRFAPPAVQQDVIARLGSADKTLLVFGRAAGYAADSGHDDVLVGLTSAQQVFPTIARYLLGQKVA